MSIVWLFLIYLSTDNIFFKLEVLQFPKIELHWIIDNFSCFEIGIGYHLTILFFCGNRVFHFFFQFQEHSLERKKILQHVDKIFPKKKHTQKLIPLGGQLWNVCFYCHDKDVGDRSRYKNNVIVQRFQIHLRINRVGKKSTANYENEIRLNI